MTDPRSPKEIEQEIERERADLSQTLDTLQDRLSVDGLVRQLTDQFREHGGEIGASVSRSVKDNPMALALTGVGLAWMIFGGKNSDDRALARSRYDFRDDRDYDRGYTPRVTHSGSTSTRSRDDSPYSSQSSSQYSSGSSSGYSSGSSSGYSSGSAASRSYDSRPGMSREISGDADTPTWVRSFDDPYDSEWDEDSDTGSTFGDRARDTSDSARDRMSGAASSASAAAGRAGDRAKSMGASASEGAASMGRSVSDAAGSARDGIRDAAGYAADRAAAMRARLAEGTEALGEEARHRVIAARERAIAARHAAADYTRQGREMAVDLFEEQPLIAGALALAVGAAIGAALPRTRLEDDYMGAQSDELVHEAERIFAEERAKIGAVASAALNEARDIANEARTGAEETMRQAKDDADRNSPSGNATQSMADKARDTARDAGQRIADAAKAEADKQGLGGQKTGGQGTGGQRMGGTGTGDQGSGGSGGTGSAKT